MKNRIVLFILGISMLSSVGFSVAAQEMSAPKEDRRTFWEKHTQKIRAAVGVLVLLGIIIGVATLGNRTKDAVDATEVKPVYYNYAIAIVVLLGPLGADRTLAFLKWANETKASTIPGLGALAPEGEKIITIGEIATMLESGIVNALAHYFYPDSQINRVSFVTKVAAIVPVTAVKEFKKDLGDVAKKISAAFSSAKK